MLCAHGHGARQDSKLSRHRTTVMGRAHCSCHELTLEEARLYTQAREAPIQRLADGVAGRFCYGVMASSAATFAFWELAGGHSPHSS